MKYISWVAFIVLSSLVSVRSQLSSRNDDTLCGVKGYDKGSPEAYDYIRGKSVDWQAKCAAKCLLDSKCASFALGKKACLLYSSSLYECFSAHVSLD